MPANIITVRRCCRLRQIKGLVGRALEYHWLWLVFRAAIAWVCDGLWNKYRRHLSLAGGLLPCQQIASRDLTCLEAAEVGHKWQQLVTKQWCC